MSFTFSNIQLYDNLPITTDLMNTLIHNDENLVGIVNGLGWGIAATAERYTNYTLGTSSEDILSTTFTVQADRMYEANFTFRSLLISASGSPDNWPIIFQFVLDDENIVLEIDAYDIDADSSSINDHYAYTTFKGILPTIANGEHTIAVRGVYGYTSEGTSDIVPTVQIEASGTGSDYYPMQLWIEDVGMYKTPGEM